MANIVTRPVNKVLLRNQKHGFAFQEKGNIYMLSNADPIESEHCDIAYAMDMSTGKLIRFSTSEYVEPVYVFTVRLQNNATRYEKVIAE